MMFRSFGINDLFFAFIFRLSLRSDCISFAWISSFSLRLVCGKWNEIKKIEPQNEIEIYEFPSGIETMCLDMFRAWQPFTILECWSFVRENGIVWITQINHSCAFPSKRIILNFIRVVNKNVSIDYRNPLK